MFLRDATFVVREKNMKFEYVTLNVLVMGTVDCGDPQA